MHWYTGLMLSGCYQLLALELLTVFSAHKSGFNL